ncbi:MAG: VWA domain-containing protein [Myxococcota bacterium]|nr:VWA domain-containing protein [Myxococcota bacterium]MDW8363593.1 VWA domain-containing protein [Myxococcales bacterium]
MRRWWRALEPVAWLAALVALVAVALVVGLASIHDGSLATVELRWQRPWAALLAAGGLLVLVARGWALRLQVPRLAVSVGSELAALPRGWRGRLSALPGAMRALAVALLGVALAGPEAVHARRDARVEGIDIMLVLDLSLSMQAADVRPDRFRAARDVVRDFIARRPNDRIGAVVFGRDAFTLMPLTTDRDALSTAIAELELGMIDGRGTAIGNGVGTALNRLRDSRAKSRVVVLLTDGDNNAGNVSPEQAAELARAMGVRLYTVLMGATDRAPVQVGVDLFGEPLLDRGEFPVNPALLRTMAERTGGQAFQIVDRRGLEDAFHRILDALDRAVLQESGRLGVDLYGLLAWPALVLVVLEALLGLFVLRRWP